MTVIVIFKNGKTETIDNVCNVYGFSNKIEIKDIKGNVYEFQHKKISGWHCYDVI